MGLLQDSDQYEQEPEELAQYSPEQYGQAPEDQPRPQRIRLWMGWSLIMTALVVDLIETLLTWVAVGVVLSPILSIGATFFFWIWFQMLGVSYTSNTKRFAITTIQAIAEIIPGLDVVPILSFLWTFGMILVVVMTRMEDRGEKPSIFGALSEVTNIGNLISGSPASGLAIKVQSLVRTNRRPRQSARVLNIVENRKTGPIQNKFKRTAPGPASIANIADYKKVEPVKKPVDVVNIADYKRTQQRKREAPQYIKDWEESTRKLNDLQHKRSVEKNYKGGMEQYEKDGEKHAEEWKNQQRTT
jgi:hypothetical protein